MGGVAERLKAPVLKTGFPKGNVGSNPTPSAKEPGLRQPDTESPLPSELTRSQWPLATSKDEVGLEH